MALGVPKKSLQSRSSSTTNGKDREGGRDAQVHAMLPATVSLGLAENQPANEPHPSNLVPQSIRLLWPARAGRGALFWGCLTLLEGVGAGGGGGGCTRRGMWHKAWQGLGHKGGRWRHLHIQLMQPHLPDLFQPSFDGLLHKFSV